MNKVIEFPKKKLSFTPEKRAELWQLFNSKGLDQTAINYILERIDYHTSNDNADFNFRLELDGSLSENVSAEIARQFQDCIDSVCSHMNQEVEKLKNQLALSELNVFQLRRKHNDGV
jgi:hypothetical protein